MLSRSATKIFRDKETESVSPQPPTSPNSPSTTPAELTFNFEFAYNCEVYSDHVLILVEDEDDKGTDVEIGQPPIEERDRKTSLTSRNSAEQNLGSACSDEDDEEFHSTVHKSRQKLKKQKTSITKNGSASPILPSVGSSKSMSSSFDDGGDWDHFDTDIVSKKKSPPNNNNNSVSNSSISSSSTSSVIMAKLYVCKLVLCSKSPYFRTLFTNGMRETNQKEIVLKMRAEDKETFIFLIKYLYTGRFPGEIDLLKMVVLADKYSVPCAVEEATRLLSRGTYTVEECCRFLDLPDLIANNQALNKLIEVASASIVKEFEDFDRMWINESFLELSARGVIEVLKSDKLKVSSENTVYQAVRTWICRNHGARDKHTALLIPHIRWPMMTLGFLMDVVTQDTIFQGIPGYQELVQQAITHHAAGEERTKIIPVVSEKTMVLNRAGYQDKLKTELLWELKPVSAMLRDGSTRKSPVQYLAGYKIWLKVEKKQEELGLFFCGEPLSVTTPVRTEKRFYAKFTCEFLMKSKSTGDYVTKAHFHPFNLTFDSVHNGRCGKGYGQYVTGAELGNQGFDFMHDDALLFKAIAQMEP